MYCSINRLLFMYFIKLNPAFYIFCPAANHNIVDCKHCKQVTCGILSGHSN